MVSTPDEEAGVALFNLYIFAWHDYVIIASIYSKFSFFYFYIKPFTLF